MLDAHVVANRVGVREEARARQHRTDGAVARVVRLEVRARSAERRQRAAAQRAVQRQPRPAAIAYRRYCQRAHALLRGICNADITIDYLGPGGWQHRRWDLASTRVWVP